jgi:hypothetical protein
VRAGLAPVRPGDQKASLVQSGRRLCNGHQQHLRSRRDVSARAWYGAVGSSQFVAGKKRPAILLMVECHSKDFTRSRYTALPGVQGSYRNWRVRAGLAPVCPGSPEGVGGAERKTTVSWPPAEPVHQKGCVSKEPGMVQFRDSSKFCGWQATASNSPHGDMPLNGLHQKQVHSTARGAGLVPQLESARWTGSSTSWFTRRRRWCRAEDACAMATSSTCAVEGMCQQRAWYGAVQR